MFHHVTMRVSDRDASERFLRTVLRPLGIEPTGGDDEFLQFHDLSIAPAREDRPLTTGLHVGLLAPSTPAVDAFWKAGTAAGYESDGEPGPRPEYASDYYGAFLLDPDGNSVEAMLHGNVRQSPGIVDHLWVRVADATASADFYTALSPGGGSRSSRASQIGFGFAARAAGRSRSSRGSPARRRSISRFPRRTVRPSTPSIAQHLPPAAATMARPACGLSTTLSTTEHLRWTPMATTSRPSATVAPDRRLSFGRFSGLTGVGR